MFFIDPRTLGLSLRTRQFQTPTRGHSDLSTTCHSISRKGENRRKKIFRLFFGSIPNLAFGFSSWKFRKKKGRKSHFQRGFSSLVKEYKKKKQGAEEENFFLLFSSFYFSFLFQILLSFFSLFVFVFGRFIEWLAARGSVKKRDSSMGKRMRVKKISKIKTQNKISATRSWARDQGKAGPIWWETRPFTRHKMRSRSYYQ